MRVTRVRPYDITILFELLLSTEMKDFSLVDRRQEEIVNIVKNKIAAA